MQAESFKIGLETNPSDRMMRQGFWDAMALLSQSRGDSSALHTLTSLPHDMSAVVNGSQDSSPSDWAPSLRLDMPDASQPVAHEVLALME
jgi:hypothetical protein